MGRHLAFPDLSHTRLRERSPRPTWKRVNHALRDMPARTACRLHLCWGNYEGPHHRDIPLKEIIGVVLRHDPRP